MMALILVLILAAPALLAGSQCIVVEGDRILAADLARANPVFERLEPDRPLAYSPLVGIERVMTAAQLRRLMELHDLGTAPAENVCFERAGELLTPERIVAVLEEALQLPEAAIELVDFSRRPVPRGELIFEIAGLSSPGNSGPEEPVLWRGTVRHDGHRSVSVWARVRISATRRQVVAIHDLPSGEPIGPGDVEERIVEAFPVEPPPLDRVEDALENLPRRRIRAGAAVYAAHLRTREAVRRGDVVEVTVYSGAAQLRFQARAETTGQPGDSILVSNPSNGTRFSAEVVGRGQVAVRAGTT